MLLDHFLAIIALSYSISRSIYKFLYCVLFCAKRQGAMYHTEYIIPMLDTITLNQQVLNIRLLRSVTSVQGQKYPCVTLAASHAWRQIEELILR